MSQNGVPLERPPWIAGTERAPLSRGRLALRLGALRSWLETGLIVVVDVLGLAAGFGLAIAVRTRMLPAMSLLFSPDIPAELAGMFWWIVSLVIGILAFGGSYRNRHPFWRELQLMVNGITLGFLLVLAIVTLVKIGDMVSRTVLVLAYVFSLLLVPASRWCGKMLLSRLGLWRRRVLVLGAGKTGEIIARALTRDRYLGYELVGFLEDDPRLRQKTVSAKGNGTAAVLGGFGDVHEVMEQYGVRHLVVAAPGMPARELVSLVNRLQREAASVLVIPDLFGIPVSTAEIDYFFDERVLGFRVRNSLASPANMIFKRVFDVVVGIVALVVALPLMAVIAVAIKLDSPGPVIFAHKRIGRGGKEFRCYKFRTMYLNADDILKQYLSTNLAAREEWEQYAKLRGYDPRVTRAGRILRKYSLDELPQIFNVLRGEMSLVGPRPYLPRERTRLGQSSETVLLARPGITGLWQVNGRNEVAFDERVRMEAWYVRNWSLWLDITVLIRTVGVVLERRGAY